MAIMKGIVAYQAAAGVGVRAWPHLEGKVARREEERHVVSVLREKKFLLEHHGN